MQELLAVAFAVSAVLSATTALIAWRHRRATPAATALTGVCAALALWSLGNAPVHLHLPALVHRSATYTTFVGVLGCVVGLYLLARTIDDPHHRPTRRQVAVLTGVPLLVLAAVATDPWHHLFFTSTGYVGDPPHFAVVYGPLFWAHTAWCYGVLAVGVGHLGRAWHRSHAAVRRQVTSVLVAAAAPLAGNAVNISNPALFAGQDITPLCFTVTALVSARAVLRQGLLRVVPIAREAVLETVTDCVVVVDAGGSVVDVNPAGRELLRRSRPDLPDPVGLAASAFLSPRALGDLPGRHVRYPIEYVPGLHLDVGVTAIHDGRGRGLGRVVVARDITEVVETRRRLEEQLELVEQLRAQLQEESVRDPLTGMHNRRFLDGAIDAALGAAVRGGTPLGVLALDVDRFKAVNDTHGHAAGDEVLVAIARTLAATVRAADTAARTGGEEFVVLLPGADERAVQERAEEVRAACAGLVVPVGDGAVVRPTVSVGTAVHPGHGADARSLLAAADRALYAAKAAGRDRVVAAGGLRTG
ncbi:diguanylate cyclase [Paenibacillus sp. TRM 82003]|uniref:histidine kinase N-terminal 7TM domain-containing diguanylate cyclase n=1 Tax=Kineococcus sp. TRM81007 TaxID=2925831 RepID=UPI001F5A0BF8|nr:diguanylate cyclase [Kineococcus sp. TRM81007]MCI2237379.1 diguanylate cyclase [Kineococcus sp. TRM81007]MCI3926514.1 diguanylate cyclase [Paenibacillus sp. TRM 82003]